jgi:hypothetical protein
MSTTIIGLIDDGKVVFGTPSPPFGRSRLSFRDDILIGIASSTDAAQDILETFAPPDWPPHFSFGSYVRMVWAPALARFIASSPDQPHAVHVLLGFADQLLLAVCELGSVRIHRPGLSGLATGLSPQFELAYASLESTVGADGFDRITAAVVAVEGPLANGMTILTT